MTQPGLREKARLTLVSDLTKLGFRVGMIANDPEHYEMFNPLFLEEARRAGVDDQNMKLIAPKSSDVGDVFAYFPRDLFIQFGETVYLNHAMRGYDLGVFQDWFWGLRWDYGAFAHGGAFVVDFASKIAFVAEESSEKFLTCSNVEEKAFITRERMSQNQGVRALKELGIRIYEMPVCWVDVLPPEVMGELGGSKRLLIPHVHTDLSVLRLNEENALFFPEPYYAENQNVLDAIVDEVRPDIFAALPEEDGLPINSLSLPDGRVYMDSAAGRSPQILRDLGIKVETTSEPFGTWAWGIMSGIHCATNVLNLPIIPTQ
jgi:hypothetical protein